MDGVALVLNGTTAALTTNVDEGLANSLGATVPIDSPAVKKERAQELKIPIASGMDTPSTVASSKASPVFIDASSASWSRTPTQAAAKSRAKAVEVVDAQAKPQTDGEHDANSFAGVAVADVVPRASRDSESLAAPGGAKRAAPVVSTSCGGLLPQSTPEVIATTKNTAASGGAAALRKQAIDAEVAAESAASSQPETAPRKVAEPAHSVVKASAPAAVKGRPKPPDRTGSAAAKRIARPQQSLQASGAAAPSRPTKASAAEGLECDEPPTTASADDGNFSLLPVMDSAVTHGEAPHKKLVQSDKTACVGESSMSALSVGGESRDSDASRGPVEGGAQASAKGETGAQRALSGHATMASTPDLPDARVNSDAGSVSSVSAATKPAALSQATEHIPEEARSDSEDSFEGRPAAAPRAPRPRAVGALAVSSSTVGGPGASSSSDSTGRKNNAAEQAALADEWNEVEARTNEFREKDAVDKGKIRANEDVLSTPITFGEVIVWVNELPLEVEVLRQSIEGEVKFTQCGCFSRRRSASIIPGLSRRCQRDKDRVFLLKSTDFDVDDLVHFRMLHTAYTKLTRNKVCPTIGKHWEVLGFQHTDPRLDLNRSGRLLNVLHFFFFFTHHFDILKSAYLLAQDEEQNFPLVCVCINLTNMVVQCLVAGKLSRLCNASDKDVLDTTCKVFAGSLFYFYMRWKTLKRTIRDTEATMKEVRGFLEKKPAKLLQALAKGVEALKQQASASKFEFTDLDFTGRAPAAGCARPGPSVPKRLRNYLAQK